MTLQFHRNVMSSFHEGFCLPEFWGALSIKSMFILCSLIGSLCMLKTGVKDGPCKGKSFYVCVEKKGCEFCQPTRYATDTEVPNRPTFSFEFKETDCKNVKVTSRL